MAATMSPPPAWLKPGHKGLAEIEIMHVTDPEPGVDNVLIRFATSWGWRYVSVPQERVRPDPR